jgi:hypothetical protein
MAKFTLAMTYANVTNLYFDLTYSEVQDIVAAHDDARRFTIWRTS